MSVWNHRLVGYMIGLRLRLKSDAEAGEAIDKLDRWAWKREWEQNLAGKNPNNPMSSHQIAEARAWGEGARSTRGMKKLPFPVPPYPVA